MFSEKGNGQTGRLIGSVSNSGIEIAYLLKPLLIDKNLKPIFTSRSSHQAVSWEGKKKNRLDREHGTAAKVSGHWPRTILLVG